MTTADEDRREARITLRRLSGRAPDRKAPGTGRLVAAPDMSWDDADHQGSQAKDNCVIDPWELEDNRTTHSAWQSSNEGRDESTLPSPISDPRPNDDQDEISRADVGINAPTHEHPPDQELVDRDQGEVAHEGELERPHEVDESEDWEALEDAEEDLVEAYGEVVNLAKVELVDNGPALIEIDEADRPVLRVEQGSTDADVPVEWPMSSDETFDADWEEETDTIADVEAFGAGPDGHAPSDGSLGFYDFDDSAQRSPWELKPADEETAIRNARTKAAAITNLLTLTTIPQRSAALRFLTELFEHLRHPSTYRALRDLAEDGLDLETLEAVVALRRVWMERTDWWVYRYRGEVRFFKHGAAALTWKLAYRVCIARWQFTPETVIGEDWRDEWLALPAGVSGYFSFPGFIAEKVDALDAESLYTGLLLEEEGSDPGTLNDDYSWHRRVSDRYGVIGQGIRILTPYDDRPGVIRAGLREVEKGGD